MSREVERVLGGSEHLVRGVAIIPYEEARKYMMRTSSSPSSIVDNHHQKAATNHDDEDNEFNPNSINRNNNTSSSSKISYFYGACKNLPDWSSVKATKRLTEMCSQLKETDVLLTLVSGGGSALLAQAIDLTGTGDDRANLALELATIKSLVKKGADINELNTVSLRKLQLFFFI